MELFFKGFSIFSFFFEICPHCFQTFPKHFPNISRTFFELFSKLFQNFSELFPTFYAASMTYTFPYSITSPRTQSCYDYGNGLYTTIFKKYNDNTSLYAIVLPFLCVQPLQKNIVYYSLSFKHQTAFSS